MCAHSQQAFYPYGLSDMGEVRGGVVGFNQRRPDMMRIKRDAARKPDQWDYRHWEKE